MINKVLCYSSQLIPATFLLFQKSQLIYFHFDYNLSLDNKSGHKELLYLIEYIFLLIGKNIYKF